MKSILFPVTAAVMAVTTFSGTACAMSAYARTMKLQCGICHTNPPALNEFGSAFMRNGFILPGHEGKGKASVPAGIGETASAHPSSGGGVQPGAASGSAGGVVTPGKDEEPPHTAPPPEPPPVKVYHWPSRDGSVYYTDNDLRQTHVQEETKKLSAPGANKIRRKKGMAVSPGGETRSKAAESMRYGSYGECMERQLENHAQPESAHETMELLVTTEKICAPYSSKRR